MFFKKIVVSDTSPLIGLSQIGLIELPRNLWGKLYIPEAVLVEVLKKEPGHREIEKAVQEGWIIAKEAQNRTVIEALSEIFGPGESECIALAKVVPPRGAGWASNRTAKAAYFHK